MHILFIDSNLKQNEANSANATVCYTSLCLSVPGMEAVLILRRIQAFYKFVATVRQ